MKLHLPKALFAAVLTAVCGAAWAADTANWTVTTDAGGNIVFNTIAEGAYDLNLGTAAITTGATQPYSITVLTTNTDGWTIPTGDVGSGLIIASTSNGSGNVQNANNFTIRFGQTAQGVYQGKAWINNWGQYDTQTLTKADGVDAITTLGATVVMNPNVTKKLQVFTAEGSQLVGNDKLINDHNLVSQYNYATLSNKGLGAEYDYSNVSTAITVTKSAAAMNGATLVGTLTAANEVALNGTTLNGTLASTGEGSFTLSGTTNLSNKTATSSNILYGETAATALADGNGYEMGSYVYSVANAGSTINIANGAKFSNTTMTAADGAYDSASGSLTITNTTAAGTYYINQGGTIAYTTDSAIASASTTNVVVNAAATLNMGAGTTLNKANLTANQNVTLDGSGLYIAGSATTLGDHVSLAGSWSGTVQLTGQLNKDVNFLSGLAKNNATIEMKGVTRWTSNWAGKGENAVSQNIKLTNNGGNAAWMYGAYYEDKSAEKEYTTYATTFSGNWSGDGNFMTNIDNSGVRGMRYIYTGDISQWTGAFKVSTSNANSVGVVQFGGNATEVNAIIQRDSGILRVVVDTDATFNKAINNASRLTINANKSATMKQNLTIDSVVMADGSSLNFCTTGSNKNLRLNAASTLNNLTVQDFDFKQFDSKEEAAEGAYTVTLSGTNEVKGLLDMSRSSKTGASLQVKAGSSLTHKGDSLWMCSTNAGILLEEGATFTRKSDFTVKGLSSVAESLGHIAWTNADGDGQFNGLNQSSVTISNAELTVTSNQTISTGLSNVTLKTGTNTITLNTDAELTGLEFGKALTISSGKTVTVNGTANYTGTTSTREVALTTGNGYGTVETYAQVIKGAGSVAGTTTWTYNGQATASYKNGELITGTETSSIYYVNDSSANISLGTEDSELIINNGVFDYDKISSGKTNLETLTLSGDSAGFKKGWFSLSGDGASLTPISGTEFDINQTGSTVSNGDATITALANYDTTLYNKLENVNLTYSNTAVQNKTLSLKNENTLGNVTMNDGATLQIQGGHTSISGTASLNDVTVNSDAQLSFSETNQSIGTLTLDAGATVTLGSADNHDAELNVTGLKVTGEGATINADLVVSDGGTMSFASGAILTMGCSVTIGDTVEVHISGADAEAIRHGSELTIINLGQLAATDVITLGSASIFIDDVEQNDFSLMRVDDADGTSRIVVAPEPATATLSLLALAGLCARRKRH